MEARELEHLHFKRYRKVTLTIARPLTQEDYERLGGIIQTLEGPAPFRVGDFLARDAKGEFPIRCEVIERHYTPRAAASSGGWTSYELLETREAAQVEAAFTLNGHTGKPGDYIVRHGQHHWIVDQDIFLTSYALVGDE